MSEHVIIQRQTFNIKDKKDVAMVIFKGIVAVFLFSLLVTVMIKLKNGQEVRTEVILFPIMISIVIYALNTTLPYKIQLL